MVATLTNAELGRKLKDAAKEAGFTLLELGSLLGVSRPTIYAYASGTLRVSTERLAQIAELTGKPITYFQPKSPEHLDQRSLTAQSLRLIDALMSPASPARASEAALKAIEEDDEPQVPGIRAELLRRSGNALAMSGDYVESIRQLEDARDLFEGVNEGAKVGSCFQTLGFCYTSLGNLSQAKVCFERALNLLPDDQTWKAEVAIAALLERSGQFDEAENCLSSLLDDPRLTEVSLAYVRANFASIVCARGRWRSGFAQTETALQAAYASGLTDQVAELLIQGSTALMHLGRLPEATLLASRARDVAFTLQDEARSTLAEVTVARLLQALGESACARATAAAAYSRAIRGQYRRSESQALLILADLALDRGDLETAIETAEQSISHSRAHHFIVAEACASMTALRAEVEMGLGARVPERLAAIKRCADSCADSQFTVMSSEAQARVANAGGDAEVYLTHLEAATDCAQRLGLKRDYERLKLELSTFDLGLPKPVTDTNRQFGTDRRIWINILKGLPIEETDELMDMENTGR